MLWIWYSEVEGVKTHQENIQLYNHQVCFIMVAVPLLALEQVPTIGYTLDTIFRFCNGKCCSSTKSGSFSEILADRGHGIETGKTIHENPIHIDPLNPRKSM